MAFQLQNPLKRALSALHPMPQNDLTIRAPLEPSREASLRERLADINKAPADNPILPLGRLDTLHFARLLIVEGPDHPGEYASALFFLANVDGPVSDFLRKLASDFGEGLDLIFASCQGYPESGARNLSSRLRFLEKHSVPSQTFYINTVGRTVRQIRDEDELYQAIQDFLDHYSPGPDDAPRDIRQAIIDFVQNHSELADMVSPRPRPGKLWKAVEQLRLAGFLVAGGIILFWGWPLLLAWLIGISVLEKADTEFTHRAPLSRLNQLRATEDFLPHNPFAAVGYVKPGLLRRITARGLLLPAQVVVRHIFNNGNLAGIPLLGLDGVYTIHFARWTLLENDRRLLFTSNYDGSMESYMVDFIDKVAWGLNIIFSNGFGYPRTRLLVFGGARNEQRFKDYLGLHQLENLVWYSPYPHLTALQMASNQVIRDGLRGHMSNRQAQAWLKRL